MAAIKLKRDACQSRGRKAEPTAHHRGGAIGRRFERTGVASFPYLSASVVSTLHSVVFCSLDRLNL